MQSREHVSGDLYCSRRNAIHARFRLGLDTLIHGSLQKRHHRLPRFGRDGFPVRGEVEVMSACLWAGFLERRTEAGVIDGISFAAPRRVDLPHSLSPL